MANLSEDIQCASSDTRLPMLDRTDFALWQQRIRLRNEGALHLGPERPRVYSDLSPEDKERYNADIRATNILLQGFPKAIYSLINHYTEQRTYGIIVKMLLEVAAGYGSNNRVGNANPGQERHVMCYNCNGERRGGWWYWYEEQLLFIASGQDNAIDEDVDEKPVQDLALNVDNVFQADDCDAFDSDVDEAHMAETMFMANLSFADPVYDEAGLSYDSDILSEVHDHDHYQDAVCEHHEEHEMHDDYVKDNAVSVVQSNVSSVSNDAYMMIFNDMHEPHAKSVFDITRNTVVDNLLTAKLATYKEQVELYERRARKQMQLASTINHNKLMVEEVTSLKKDLKPKENKYLEEFLDMKALKEKDKIAPPDFSKENYFAIFIPQKQLTPEQIFWSQDLIKIKEKALKEQTTAFRPIKALTVYAIDVEPIPPHNRNNREVHLDYLKHLKESVETLREIVKEAKVERPFDRSLESAYLYTKHSLELLEYAIGTCPKV
ncbi:hypothetical protein Tco_0565526 [Tanacetum coccineum]